MKKSIFFIAAGLTASLLVGYTMLSLNLTDQHKEEKYLPIAKSIIAAEVVDMDEYGSFYIDRKDGMKFVLALSKEDEKSKQLKEALQEKIPEDILVVKTNYKYPLAELKKVNQELSEQMPKLRSNGNDVVSTYIDEAADKVILDARSVTEDLKTELTNKYGNKVGFHIDPNLSNPTASVVDN
ncbi:MAG: hypothetical protein WCC10_01410 [Tumebacillaceae bacterium]